MDPRHAEWGRKLDGKAAFYDLGPEAILARCLWAEARGTALDEKQAVGCVIRNRVHWWVPTAKRGPQSWGAIILQPKQFSWTMESDPNLLKVLDPVASEGPNTWEICCQVAEGVVSGIVADATSSADHYYDRSLDAKPPYWAASMVPTLATQRFRFFRSNRVRLT